jgi:hypothetical protein
LDWLRGLDLNQRPSGYEPQFGHYAVEGQAAKTNKITETFALWLFLFVRFSTPFTDKRRTLAPLENNHTRDASNKLFAPCAMTNGDRIWRFS